MWLPRWVGEIYARLFARFGTELFMFQEAVEVLGVPDNRVAVGFSRLHACRALMVFAATRPRRYRLLRPENFLLLAAEEIRGVDRIPQERYVQLVCDVFREVRQVVDLTALALYGSVARGTAAPNSDLDLLVVSPDFTGSVGQRITVLYEAEKRVREELRWLHQHGVYVTLSFYPLHPREVRRLPPILLDVSEEGIVLYDRERVLEEALLQLRLRLLKLKARRVFLDENRWYWDLKPDYRFGERVVL